MTTPEVTVAICTFNRAALLSTCLEAIVAQSARNDRYEVLVVDNNSSDSTAEATMSFGDRIPTLRYVFEGVQGLSRARNRALEEASAPIILYVDDDAVAYPDWIERFIEAFERFPEATIVGGESEPVFESERPEWLSDTILHLYSCGLNYSDDYLFLEGSQWLVECNLGYRVGPLRTVGGFPESLGRKGSTLLSGDGAVNRVLVHNGARMLYTPFARVQHLVPESRLTPRWVAQRRFWGGVTAAVEDAYLAHSTNQAEPWRDLLLPCKITEWEALTNLYADEHFEHHLTRISHLGYLLAKAGFVGS